MKIPQLLTISCQQPFSQFLNHSIRIGILVGISLVTSELAFRILARYQRLPSKQNGDKLALLATVSGVMVALYFGRTVSNCTFGSIEAVMVVASNYFAFQNFRAAAPPAAAPPAAAPQEASS